MAVPTITSLSPTAGHTGGGTIVAIEGTNFRLPNAPAPINNQTPEAPPSMQFIFGGTPAKNVAVVSSTLAYVQTPVHDATEAAVAVQALNCDDDGDPIPGETFTFAGAWRFLLPDLSTDDSDLVRIIRAFEAELKRQVTPNTTWPQNTDYDEDTSDTVSMTEVPKFPGLIIVATELSDNDFYSERSKVEVPHPDDPTVFVTYAPPVTVDIVFTLVGVSDNSKELLNLAATTRRYFRKNPYIAMLRDPADASKGMVQYEMNAEDAPNVRIKVDGNEDNLRTFSLTAKIIGFDIEAMHEIRNSDGTPVRGPGDSNEGATEIGNTLENEVTLSIEV